MTTRQWKRACRVEFAAFVDYTFRWTTNNDFILDPDDATMLLVHAIHNYRDWNTLDCLMPRGAGKTTILQLGDIWMTDHHPWLQTILLSATPKVAEQCMDYTLYILNEHPLLDHMRPRHYDRSKKYIDLFTRRGKGRSFQFMTSVTRKTGSRCFNLTIDDLEVPETVSSPKMRDQMRTTLSESYNLFYKGAKFRKRKKVGTPWDADTIMREGTPDVHIEVPAIVVEDDGSRTYPFTLMGEAELQEIRTELNNDWMFRAQYLLDTSRSEELQPINEDMVRFGKFSPCDIKHRMLLMDPAGGKRTADDLRQLRAGKKKGDGMTVIAAGVRNDMLFVFDIFSDSTTVENYMNTTARFARTYDARRTEIEDNYGGQSWAELVKLKFRADRIPNRIDSFKTTGNKLDKIIEVLVPMFQDSRIIFHERLMHYNLLTDSQDSQLYGLRYHSLPAHDDVPDALAMMILKLSKHLHVKQRQKRVSHPWLTGVPESELDARGVPDAVRQVSKLAEQQMKRDRRVAAIPSLYDASLRN